MEERMRNLEVAVAGIGSRLDAVLRTPVTKADLHEALHAQTSKIVTAAFGLAGLMLAGIRVLH